MAYGSSGDYEWEEVEEEDWEVICVDDEEQKTGVPRTGIEFTLEADEPQRRTKRTITKREREAAAAVHRSHVLCLLARALLLDWAAAQPEVQATALSLLPPGSALRNQSSEEPQRAINGMLPLVTWFRSTFAVLPPDLVGPRTGQGTGRRWRPEDELDEQLLRTARAAAGTVECLVALFAALVRAQGGSARVVRLLDVVPLAPWRARPKTVRTVVATAGVPPPPPSGTGGGGGGGGGSRRALDLEAGDELPPPPPPPPPPPVSRPGQGNAAAAAGGASGGAKGRKGRRLEDVLADRGYGGGRGKKRRVEGEAGEGGAGGGGGGGVSRSKSTQVAVGRGPAEGTAKARGGKRQKEESKGGGGGSVPAAEGVCCPGQDAATAAGDDGCRSRPSNKGDEEFELQLQMALLATGREAEVRRRKGQEGGPAADGNGNGGGAVRSQSRGGAEAGGGGGGGGDGPGGKAVVANGSGSGSGAPAGTAMSVRPEVVVSCWAEVYCGSADKGRWIPVDVVNGYVDRPELIDTATQRPTPVCYVVAAELGALVDVTPRYCHNLLAAKRNRDEAWWTATADIVQRQPGSAGGGNRGCVGGGGGGGGVGDLRAAREAAELHQRGLSQLQGLPTSIEGFKSHPLYVLKRHIGKYESLRPGTAPLGLHRGEPYYPRNQLSVLHTVERWRREGRQVAAQVRDSELRSPAKVVKKRLMGGTAAAAVAAGPTGAARRTASTRAGGKGLNGGNDEGEEDGDEDVLMLEAAGEGSAAAGAADGGGPTINLYGRWQTDPWVPPVAEGGIVPKNERGNVECPPLVPELPRGTVHITLGPGLGALCRTLGLDFAPGLVGFEVQGGRMVPRLDGVVVCEEVSELVVAAYLERETARAAAAAAKLRRVAVAAWRRLLGALRVRLQLERDYGDGDGAGAFGAGAGATTGAAQIQIQQQQQQQQLLSGAAAAGGWELEEALGPDTRADVEAVCEGEGEGYSGAAAAAGPGRIPGRWGHNPVLFMGAGQLAPPALAAEAVSSRGGADGGDVDFLRGGSGTSSKLSDLTSWLTDKLRPPEPEPVRVGSMEGTNNRSNIVQGVKDAASAAANRAADAASKAAEAANRAAERSGLTASPSRPIDVPTNSELLSAVAKPSPAPGKGPVEEAARAEARSESSEPALRAEAVAAGRPEPAVEGGKANCSAP
ncbi:hypothetical protein VOLCADRAFT_89729 [Volvox carteri f. nagariensis]|uniref:Rad4 beta-hairpin domain-containing protein n=1 Tax=Volvox carteri f. nagariensis TaxID=3068 RepID=D8TSH3_VOLCA|nr:uncharacterized protein VOLCADRAFT_89729 [Volvox carteri f. nagariensis]EFJ49372.1 hypothetical protein VOLCADRAFT_89729 [Volvox carteri f. nagariensis]|eukprot:XP_002949353.1 hypothetical protein VOLCADRAFT_89729 [Volvox carteri f. nagariensis]